MRFANRTAIVTGAASGIGRATAERLASEGARVALLDIDATAGEAEMKRAGEGVIMNLPDGIWGLHGNMGFASDRA